MKKLQGPQSVAHIHYDPKVDVLYIATAKGMEEEFVEVIPGVHVELNRKREVIGIEILNASRFLKPVLKPLEKRLHLTRA